MPSGLIISDNWRVGTRPALSVVSSAARRYWRASSSPSAARIVFSAYLAAVISMRGFVKYAAETVGRAASTAGASTGVASTAEVVCSTMAVSLSVGRVSSSTADSSAAISVT